MLCSASPRGMRARLSSLLSPSQQFTIGSLTDCLTGRLTQTILVEGDGLTRLESHPGLPLTVRLRGGDLALISRLLSWLTRLLQNRPLLTGNLPVPLPLSVHRSLLLQLLLRLPVSLAGAAAKSDGFLTFFFFCLSI